MEKEKLVYADLEISQIVVWHPTGDTAQCIVRRKDFDEGTWISEIPKEFLIENGYTTIGEIN